MFLSNYILQLSIQELCSWDRYYTLCTGLVFHATSATNCLFKLRPPPSISVATVLPPYSIPLEGRDPSGEGCAKPALSANIH